MTIDEYKKEVKQIRPQMLFIAQSYLRDNDEAEDVVQDVLLKLWQLLASCLSACEESLYRCSSSASLYGRGEGFYRR